MSDDENVWQFNFTSDFFGPDPIPGSAKELTIVYRIAVITGTQAGQLLDPTAPGCWTQQWYDQRPALLQMSEYPVLSDVSGFQMKTVRQGGPISIDIGSSADLTPFRAPVVGKQILCANYSYVDVTQATQRLLYSSGNPSNALAVYPSTSGIQDPEPDIVKQFVAIAAFPLEAQMGFNLRTLIGVDGVWVTGPAETPALNPSWPQPYNPQTYRSIKFTDQFVVCGWPQVYRNGQVVWCPRPSAGQHGPWYLSCVCKWFWRM